MFIFAVHLLLPLLRFHLLMQLSCTIFLTASKLNVIILLHFLAATYRY